MEFSEKTHRLLDQIMIERESHKDDECQNPPHPFDLAHKYEHETVYHNDEKTSGYSCSKCRKCGYVHPSSVTFFARIPIPLGYKTTGEGE